MIPRVYEVWDVLCVMHVNYPTLPVVAGSSSRPRTEMKPGRDLIHWLGHVIWSFRLRMLRWRTKHVPVLEPKQAPRVVGPWVHHCLEVILFLLMVRLWCLYMGATPFAWGITFGPCSSSLHILPWCGSPRWKPCTIQSIHDILGCCFLLGGVRLERPLILPTIVFSWRCFECAQGCSSLFGLCGKNLKCGSQSSGQLYQSLLVKCYLVVGWRMAEDS
jgi:hypothetical protein